MGNNMDFKDMNERMKDLDDSTNDSSQPGDMDGRATMVPPGGFPTLQMLNIMERMKESERSGKGESEITLTPMNLTTMLSNAGSRELSRDHPGNGGRRGHSDSSMSPNGGDDIEDEDVVEEEDHRREAESSTSSSAGRERHPSADIRAQFMADLRRLGGNIPTQSGAGDEQAASSTTHSPPHLPQTSQISPPAAASAASGRPNEDNLPPRKRKVSQEHRMSAASSTEGSVVGGHPQPQPAEGPGFNGIHDRKGSVSPQPQTLSMDSEGSSHSGIKEDSKGLESRN